MLIQLLMASGLSRFAKIKIGEPPQEIELDIDMLTSDFYILTTTSSKGSKYDDYFSKTAGNLRCFALYRSFQADHIHVRSWIYCASIFPMLSSN